jgi:hypothetical protein
MAYHKATNSRATALADRRLPFEKPSVREARRAALRVLRRDFLRPLRRGVPLPMGAFERLADRCEDLRLAGLDDAA